MVLPGAGAGPYREAATGPEPSVATTCPYCSNEVPALVRICPHCDVRLDSVRCQQCYSLQPPGAFACGRCACPLELEPLLDATDAPCPKCQHPLEVAPGGDARVHECPRCGGMFVPRDALAEILVRAEVGGTLRERVPARRSSAPGGWSVDVDGPRSSGILEDVRYVMCPLCHSSMNRVNFGRVSGVIVDVCKTHGTWFDAGELTRVVAFASSGGLEKSRTREAERAEAEKKASKKSAAEAHAALLTFEVRHDLESRTEAWRDFLRALMRW